MACIRGQRYRGILIFALLALPMLSYLLLLFNPNSFLLQVMVLILGSAAFIGGLIALRRAADEAEKKLFMLAAGAGLLIMAGLCWNTLFLIYIRATGYEGDVFRHIMHNAHSPIYGWSAWSKWPWSFILVLFSGAFIARIMNWSDTWIESPKFKMELPLWLAGFILACALSDGPERLRDMYAEYGCFASDILYFEGLRHVLRTYSQHMPFLSINGGHYPPGNMLLIMMGQDLGVTWFAHFVVMCFTVLTLIPIAGMASELHLSDYTKNISFALYVSSSVVLSMPSIGMTPIPMFFAAASLWLALKAIHRESYLYAAAVGVLMTVFSFFSYSSMVAWGLLILVASALMLVNKVRPGILLKMGFLAFATFLLLCWMLYLFTGFNQFVSLMFAIQHNRFIMSSGYDSILRYLLRSTGNLIAWMFGIGFVASVFGILAGNYLMLRPVEGDREAGAFSAAVLCTVLFAAFSTLFFLETERVWLMFVPPWIISAAVALGEVSQGNGNSLLKRLLIFSVLTAIGQELVFQQCI